MADETLTRVLAVWGAVPSTVLGLIKIREAWHDRPRLKVYLRPDMKAARRRPTATWRRVRTRPS